LARGTTISGFDTVDSLSKFLTLLISFLENRMKLLKEFIGQLFEPATNPVPTIENVTAFIDLKAKYTSAINQYNSLS